VLFLGWAGIRGGDSLVIALALPYVAASGAPLQGRAAIIFITFIVIFVTLVAQGLTLAPLIRLLGIVGGDEEAREERTARTTSIRAGAEALEGLVAQQDHEAETAAALRRAAAYRLEQLSGDGSAPGSTSGYVQLRLRMLAAEREAVITLRDRGEISDAVMIRLQRELDHEEVVLRGTTAE
jgi:CPA1 family monovalent cation:H+ antiporter